jgi:hypothetical protein
MHDVYLQILGSKNSHRSALSEKGGSVSGVEVLTKERDGGLLGYENPIPFQKKNLRIIFLDSDLLESDIPIPFR